MTIRIGAALALLAAPATAQDTTLRFASITPEAGYIHSEHLAPFAEAVEEASGGSLTLDLQPVGVYGQAGQLLDLVENGIVDMAWIVNGYTPGRFERSGVIELPFLYDSAEEATDAYYTLFEEDLIAEDFEGLHVIALWTHRPYGTFTNGTPVETAEDFAGLKMRVPSDVTAQTVEALGGAPVGMPVTEIAEALRLGTVDGSMFPYEAVAPFGLEGLFTHFTNTGTLATRFAVVMNEDAHARLSEEQRVALDGLSGREFSMAMARGFDEAEAEVEARYREDPEVTVIDPAPEVLAAMREAVAPVLEDWVAQTGGDAQALLDRAQALADGS